MRLTFAKPEFISIGIITIILFCIPFTWLRPGEMDLGGDSSRIYFYDPVSSLRSFGVYSVVSSGTDELAYNQYLLPYYIFIAGLRYLFDSTTIVISIMNGVKLAGSFLFMYVVIRELIQRDESSMKTASWVACGIAAGFYTLSPAIVDNMRYALSTHDQIFLNPLLAWLLLRYMKSHDLLYLWLVLLISFIFSPNFFLAVPPFWAFYPLFMVFLIFYTIFVLKRPFPWAGLLFGLVFFVALNAYHIFPTISNIFDKGSEFNTRTFESFQTVNKGLEYFNAILGLGKVSKNILLPLELVKNSWGLIFVPLSVIAGLLTKTKKSATFYLVSLFFFITLFLTSANITSVGVTIYRSLFSIPGFGMFRNFIGQWQWIHTFFFAIFVAYALMYLFRFMKLKYIIAISFIITTSLILRSWIVFDGHIVRVSTRGSKDVTALIKMDPDYEALITHIRQIPNDGRIFQMPFTDFSYNILSGANNGVYVGQSLIPYLTGRNDFPAYQNIDPFSEVFRRLLKEKNYPLIRHMMSLLQVRYVLYNSSPMVTNAFFTEFPYGYTGAPTDPSGMKEFVENTSMKEVFRRGNFSLSEIDLSGYLPHFYIPKTVYIYDTVPKYDEEFSKALSFFPESEEMLSDPRVAYIDRVTCQSVLGLEACKGTKYDIDISGITISFQRITPTKYKLHMQGAGNPFFLVFQNTTNPYWKIFPTESFPVDAPIADSYFDNSIREFVPKGDAFDNNPLETNGKTPIADNRHIVANGYASTWYVMPEDVLTSASQTYIVELTAQKKVYVSMAITGVGICIFLLIGGWLVYRKART